MFVTLVYYINAGHVGSDKELLANGDQTSRYNCLRIKFSVLLLHFLLF